MEINMAVEIRCEIRKQHPEIVSTIVELEDIRLRSSIHHKKKHS